MEGETKEEDEIEYDQDDNPIYKKREIGGLPPIDHSSMEYIYFVLTPSDTKISPKTFLSNLKISHP
jgi:hypothetical protein